MTQGATFSRKVPARLREFTQRLLRAGVTWGFFSTGLRAMSAVVLLPLATRMVPTEQLALWYIFTTVLVFVISMDFGITNTASRQIAALWQSSETRIGEHLNSLRDYLAHLRLIYWILGISSLTVLSLAGGWWVWTRSAGMPDQSLVHEAWILFCPSFLFAVAGNQGRALLFGANRLNTYYLISCVAIVLQFGFTIVGLLAGLQLKALVLGNLVLFATMVITTPLGWKNMPAATPWVPRPLQPAIIRGLLKTSLGTFLNNLAAYLVLAANVLVASKYLPLSEMASYGLTLQIIVLGSQASITWILVKHPLYASLSQSDLPSLQKMLISRLRLTLLTFLAGMAVILVAGNPLLQVVGAHTHFLPAPQMIVLAIFIMLYLHQSEFEALALCLGKNPFACNLLVSGIAGLGLICVLSPRLGVWGVILGPLLTQLVFNNWWIVAKGLKMIHLDPGEYVCRLLFPWTFKPRSSQHP